MMMGKYTTNDLMGWRSSISSIYIGGEDQSVDAKDNSLSLPYFKHVWSKGEVNDVKI